MTDSKFEGQVLGGYHFIKLLGRGGFGDVYLAEHTVIKNLCAIKALRIYEEKDIELVRAEAQILGKLDHDHIIKILYFFVAEQTPFLVMEYAPNGSLRDLHPHGTRLSPSIILSYTKQVVSALQYLHNEDNKLVHCDIKPENLLLSKRNKVLLNDFGLTKITGSAHYDLERFGGDVRYMAPEQIKGKPQRASDQYSLAMTVYEWLCGTLPFPGGNFIQISYQHISTQPEPLRTYIPSIPPKVEAVVLKALSNAPKDRYPNIGAFAHALEDAIRLPFEEYYRPDVALAIRNRYYEYLGVNWGEPKEITREEAEKIYISPKGTKGYKYAFTRSAIYWSEAWGAQPVWGGFAERHEEHKGISGRLGFPITAEFEATKSRQGTNGVGQRFEWDWTYHVSHPDGQGVSYGATMYYSKKYYAAYLTAGHIGEAYEKHGGTSGKLGFPISNSSKVSSPNGAKGYAQQFEGGYIYWCESKHKTARIIEGAIEKQYHNLEGVKGRLGFPLTDQFKATESPQKTKGWGQRFEGGPADGWPKENDEWDFTKGVSIYYSEQYGAYPVWGGIGISYEQQGGTSSPLGFPTSFEQGKASSLVDKGWYQNFEGGDIYWCDKFNGVVVTDAILKVFNQFDGVKSKFGFPKSPETAVEGHPELRVQEFDGGVICVMKEIQ